MISELRLCFHRITLNETEEQITIQTPSGNYIISNLSIGLRTAFQTLHIGGTIEQIQASLAARDILRMQTYLRQFARYIERQLYRNNHLIASATPISDYYQSIPFDSKTVYTLSRFVYLRHDNNHYILESPTAYMRVWLSSAGLLDTWQHDGELRELFCIAGMLTPVDEPQSHSLNLWDFHDLLFLAKTRERFEREKNTTTPWSLPVVKPPMSDRVIPLLAPDIQYLSHNDLPFTQVLENRRSVRQYHSLITLDQLGEFLYRTCRIQDTVNGTVYDTTRRVYPSAGASYTLEVYAVINQCQGIEQGFYHYCPSRHVLEQLPVAYDLAAPLLQEAVLYTGNRIETPQVLLIITARFGRILWKYDSTALSLILKDVGGLFQTMYLVATAMQLAPCAIGVGNSDHFAIASKLDYYAETSIGEFLLGV